MRDDPSQVEAILTRFGERSSGDITFNKRTAASRPGTYDVTVTQARTRAEVNGADPAEALAANEQLTIRFNRRAQSNDNTIDLSVDLLAGDTPDDQVTKINTALADTSLDVTAFINATGHLSVRANEYGEDYRVYLLSDLAGGAGTTGVGNVELDDFGTELIGLMVVPKPPPSTIQHCVVTKAIEPKASRSPFQMIPLALPAKFALLMVSPIVFPKSPRDSRAAEGSCEVGPTVSDLGLQTQRTRSSDSNGEWRPKKKDYEGNSPVWKSPWVS